MSPPTPLDLECAAHRLGKRVHLRAVALRGEVRVLRGAAQRIFCDTRAERPSLLLKRETRTLSVPKSTPATILTRSLRDNLAEVDGAAEMHAYPEGVEHRRLDGERLCGSLFVRCVGDVDM